jgi:hypothetical protein
MNHIKNFLKFVNESGDSAHELSRLGLISKNAVFIRDIEKIVDLCPNLEYVTYPNGSFGLTSVPMEKEDELFLKLVWRRLISIGAITPDLKTRLNMLGRENKYVERDKLVMQTGLEEFTEEELADMKREASQSKANGLRAMIDALHELDATGDFELKLWDIRAQRTSNKTHIQVPSRSYQNYDTREVLKFLTGNPEYCQQITTLQIAAESEASRQHAARMSRGDFGPLD